MDPRTEIHQPVVRNIFICLVMVFLQWVIHYLCLMGGEISLHMSTDMSSVVYIVS